MKLWATCTAVAPAAKADDQKFRPAWSGARQKAASYRRKTSEFFASPAIVNVPDFSSWLSAKDSINAPRLVPDANVLSQYAAPATSAGRPKIFWYSLLTKSES